MTAQQVIWDEAISFPSSIQTNPPQHWVSVGERVKGTASTARGRQYEWDQVQTAEYTPTLINQDGALSPVNTSSPYAPNVLPRRPYRKRFQYPATQNILTVDQATAGSTQAAGQQVSVAVPVWFSWGPQWMIVAEPDAFTGPNVFQQVLSSPQVAPFTAFDMDGWSAKPGAWHSAQVWMRATAGGTSPQARAVIIWRTSTGGTLATSTGPTVTLTANSRTWQQLTVSGQAPAGACGGTLQVQMMNSVTVTWEAGGFQIEYAASPTAWTRPGNWYYLLDGWTDRWPMAKDKNGTYSLSTPKVVDTFARLAAIYPPPPFYADVLASGPAFFFPLDEAFQVSSVRELSSHYNPAPIVSSPQGAGSLAMGQGSNTGTAPFAGFIGAPGPTPQFHNVDSPGGVSSPGTYIELDAVGITGPPVGNWTRMMAFNCSQVPSNTATIWSANQGVWKVNPSQLAAAAGVFVSGQALNPGQLAVELATGTNASPTLWYSGSSLCDSNWHLVFLVSSSNGNVITCYIDGVAHTIYSGSTPTTPAGPCDSDTIGMGVINNIYQQGMQGEIAHIAQWNSALSSTQIANLYESWRFAWEGESSGERYLRILNYSGYAGVSFIDFGATTDMGPATDIDGATDALTLLGNVVTTEAGNHYVRADGAIIFESRSKRYNQLTPQFTFGNNTAAGEFPFSDVDWDYDLDHVANSAEVTVQQTNQVFTASSTAAQDLFDTLTLQRTINVNDPQEAVDAATYFVNRYSQPLLRCASLTLNPARYSPDGGVTFPLWAVCGQLDISTRIRINDRPLGQPPIQFDGFVENVAWTVDPSTGDHLLVLQCSPADLNLYWVLSALHTTMASASTAGATSVTVAPFPDGFANPPSASFCSGLQLTLEPGTANTETLTVQSITGGNPLVPNPQFTSLTGYGALGSATLTLVAGQYAGVSACQCTSTQGSTPTGVTMNVITPGVTAGATYYVGCAVNLSQTATVHVGIDWYTSGSTYISTTLVTFANTPAGWQTLVGTLVAPASATQFASHVDAVLPVGATLTVTNLLTAAPVTVAFTAATAHNHAAGAVVCEALPVHITNPTTWDAASILGTSTTLAY